MYSYSQTAWPRHSDSMNELMPGVEVGVQNELTASITDSRTRLGSRHQLTSRQVGTNDFD